jgi:hypothetical protein
MRVQGAAALPIHDSLANLEQAGKDGQTQKTADQIELSADGRTLRFKLTLASDINLEAFRVIVRGQN